MVNLSLRFLDQTVQLDLPVREPLALLRELRVHRSQLLALPRLLLQLLNQLLLRLNQQDLVFLLVLREHLLELSLITHHVRLRPREPLEQFVLLPLEVLLHRYKHLTVLS